MPCLANYTPPLAIYMLLPTHLHLSPNHLHTSCSHLHFFHSCLHTSCSHYTSPIFTYTPLVFKSITLLQQSFTHLLQSFTLLQQSFTHISWPFHIPLLTMTGKQQSQCYFQMPSLRWVCQTYICAAMGIVSVSVIQATQANPKPAVYCLKPVFC